MSRPSSKLRGFTLVELLVSIGIVLVILSVVLFSQNGYTESAALGNVADNIASTVAQAQAYGIAVKERTPGSADFSVAYGLTFSLLDPSYNASYISFVDRNANDIYDDPWSCPLGGSSECLEKTTITRGNYLSSLCTIPSSGTEDCATAKRVDISFLRPAPEARIAVFNAAGSTYTPGNMIGVRLMLKSPSGLVRSVAIYQSGQASVQ